MNRREFTETNDSLYQRGATDGLPVVPPTEERVAELLRGTDLPRDHEIGRLGNREGELTVEKLAVNGVMAGCLPVHMPVLVAGARAMVHPDSNVIQVSVSTGSWAYLWLVNGPIREALDIRSSFAPGARANQVIGRALGLAYKNTALIHPGEKDMGVQGNPFKYGLLAGENEERSPWDPVHVSEGFEEEDSTLTLGGPNGFGQYTTHEDANVRQILKQVIYNTPPWMSGKERESFRSWVVHALSPADARTLAAAGMTKYDVKEFLCENDDLVGPERYPGFITSGDDTDVEALRTPRYENPELVKLPVIGEGGRENLVIGPSLGGPVTVEIDLPDGWERLLSEYASEPGGFDVDEDHAWRDVLGSS